MTDQPTADCTADLQDDPEQAARDEALRAVDAALLRMAHAAGAEIRERSPWPGSSLTISSAAPATGIRFALMLRGYAHQKLYDFIKDARQDGMTWAQIGETLNLGDEASERGYGIGDAAFDFAADAEHASRFQTLTFSWTCPACGAYISDRGPNGGHPEDEEPGHNADCSRLATAVVAYDARWADE
jgi:hypothetical protein